MTTFQKVLVYASWAVCALTLLVLGSRGAA